jgi:hypothetical protein
MVAAALAAILWAQSAPPPVPDAPAPIALPIDLRWDAPAGCPDLVVVRANVARGLPAVPMGVGPMLVSVVVRAVDPEHWQASLDLRGVDWTATRTLKGASCAAVADAAGLVIGLALTSELAAQPVVVAAPPRPPAPALAPAPTLSTPVVALGAAGDTSALPSATAGGALALGWRWTHARAEARGSLFASRGGDVAAFPDTGGRLSLASFAGRGCALVGWVVSVGPCALAGVDRLHGTGAGPIMTGNVTSLAPFLGAGVQVEGRLSRHVAAFASVEADFPLVRARFSVENLGQVHQPAAVSFRGAAGLELRFR